MKSTNIRLSKLYQYRCILIFLILISANTHAESSKNNKVQEHPVIINNVNNSPPASAQEKISEQERNALIFQIAESSKNEVTNWGKNQLLWFTLAGGLGLLLGGLAYIRYLSERITENLFNKKEKEVEKQLVKLELAIESQLNKLDAARTEAIKATSIAMADLENTKIALAELQRFEITLKAQMVKNEEQLDMLNIKHEESKKATKDDYKKLEEDLNDDTALLTSRVQAHQAWITELDQDYKAAYLVIDNLINRFKSSQDTDEKLTLLNQLSHFDDKDGRILSTLNEVLNESSDIAVISELLSFIGKSKQLQAAFTILEQKTCELSNPHTAAILGALGSIQEQSNDEAFTKKIAEKIIIHLQDYLTEEIHDDDLPNVINAAVMALTYSKSYAEPAIPLLIKLLDDPTNNEYKLNSAIVLGDLGEKANTAIPSLTRLAKSESTTMSIVAEEAIAKIKNL